MWAGVLGRERDLGMAYVPMITVKYLGNGLAQQTINVPESVMDEIRRRLQESEMRLCAEIWSKRPASSNEN